MNSILDYQLKNKGNFSIYAFAHAVAYMWIDIGKIQFPWHIYHGKILLFFVFAIVVS